MHQTNMNVHDDGIMSLAATDPRDQGYLSTVMNQYWSGLGLFDDTPALGLGLGWDSSFV